MILKYESYKDCDFTMENIVIVYLNLVSSTYTIQRR